MYMNRNYISNTIKGALALLSVILLSSCNKNLPDHLDALDNDVTYTTTTYEPVLGRTTLFNNNVNVGKNSTLPLDFKIYSIRTANGDPAPELTSKFPVKVWKKAYTGAETTLAEIESKREVQYRPLLEIQEKSGEITMWNPGRSSFVKNSPDPGYVFDVEISNTGGRKFARNLKLKPYKERPYEPSTIDPATGLSLRPYVFPSLMVNTVGERTGQFLGFGDMVVYFFKNEEQAGNSLTFSFVDSLNNYINPDKFNATNWEKLIHGFDMVKTNQKVTYKVAYPIPLINQRTDYTNIDGTRASVTFAYRRLGFGGGSVLARLGLDFAIFEEGNWEIQFRFTGESPRFTNE
ncbi:Uncharacterised protein [Sphingobacterium spiritivorum]|uniref:DUF5007 domain-containing protein n=2 Tax=Sphingobacterium spiritivorum TaxID=258 RepID=A0A380C549_SPHSI|nr:Uncharacterised protein [Sphingobacterium spiritivorum]